MFENWSSQVGWATVFAALGWGTTTGVGLFVWVKGLGIREADHKRLDERFTSLEARVKKAEESFMPGSAIERRFDTVEADHVTLLQRLERHETAVAAGTMIMREQMNKGFADGAKEYATKTEVAAVETRTVQMTERIYSVLNRIETKVDNALSQRTH